MIPDVDAADRMRGAGAGLQVADIDEVRGVDDALEHRPGLRDGLRVVGLQGRRADRADARVVAAEAVDPRRDPDRLVGRHQLAAGDRVNLVPALAGPLSDPLRRCLALLRGSFRQNAHCCPLVIPGRLRSGREAS